MKSTKPKPPEQDRSIIIVKDGNGYELRVWNRLLGDAPLGARLGRKDGFPQLPRKASTYQSALGLVQQWQTWLDAQPITGRGKGRK